MEALEKYLECFDDCDALRANCEDYRAAASSDIENDDADCGKKLNMPLLEHLASRGVFERCCDPMALWRPRASNEFGEALDATHYKAEVIPDKIAGRISAFFKELVWLPATPQLTA